MLAVVSKSAPPKPPRQRQPRRGKKLRNEPGGPPSNQDDSDGDPRLPGEIWQVLKEMLADVEALSRVQDALILKGDDAIHASMVRTFSKPYIDSVADAVRRYAILPTAEQLAKEFTTDELQKLLALVQPPVDYWRMEITKPSSTIPETMRRRRRHMRAQQLHHQLDPSSHRTLDQQRADHAKELGVSVDYLRKIPNETRDNPVVAGGVVALVAEASAMHPAFESYFKVKTKS